MFAIFVTYAVFPAFCISSQNFIKWKPYKPKSSLLWKEGKGKGKQNKTKTTVDDCFYHALNTLYKCVTEIRDYYLWKIPCCWFVHLHASTDSMTDQRRWENIQSQIHVRLCTRQAHMKQMFPEAPWGARKISDQSYSTFESPTVLHLPAISGRYRDSEQLSGWLGWRRQWLQGCLCGCQSSVTAPTASARAQTTEQSAQDNLLSYWWEHLRVILCSDLGESKQ